MIRKLAIYFIAALPLVKAGYPVTTEGLNCRKGPGTNFDIVKSYAKNAYISISCQIQGQIVENVSLWDRTSDNCYVTDRWVHTGTSGFVAPVCQSNGGGSKGYRIKAADVNCREGPGTNFKGVKKYAKDAYVGITCQTHGETINGHTVWDRTSDGCFVTDYYVETGTDAMVAPACPGGGGGNNGGGDGGESVADGSITRSEIMARAEYWIMQHVPYSMDDYYPDVNGVRYRTDCSGFVSMALHLRSSLNTVTLPDVAQGISWSQLLPGDFVGTLGPGTGGAAGHVTLFEKWLNSGQTRYQTLECKGDQGCVRFSRDKGWNVDSFVSKPYRYTRVKA